MHAKLTGGFVERSVGARVRDWSVAALCHAALLTACSHGETEPRAAEQDAAIHAPPSAAADAGISERSTSSGAVTGGAVAGAAVAGCPVHVSVTTSSYGTGNQDDDDYAPNNVGAIWITTPDGSFVRTIAAWGPNYWEFATNWVKQSNGSRVDIVSAATRKNHDRPVEATWDCRDKNLQPVAAGSYRVNCEFAETEDASRWLGGDMAVAFEIGAGADNATHPSSGAFGGVSIRVTQP